MRAKAAANNTATSGTPPMRWQPADSAKAIMLIVHGLGEHSGRYLDMMKDMAGRGIVCAALDLPGHGDDARKRGVIDTYNHLLDTVSDALGVVRQLYPDLPIYLYGHSMGGGVILAYGLRYFEPKFTDISGYIASAPLIRPAQPISAVLNLLVRGLYRIAPKVSFKNKISPEQISTLPDEQAAYRDDPAVHDRISAALAVGMIENGVWLEAHAEEWTAPLLLMHARRDALASFAASEAFAASAKSCTFIAYDDVAHEIHNDSSRAAVYGAIASFIDTQQKVS